MKPGESAALTFIHGGCHDGGSWDATLLAMAKLMPHTQAFAVDLPGRRGVPGNLASLTLHDCAISVAEQINARIGTERSVVLVGHSLAGVIIPGVLRHIGTQRVAKIVLVACCVPPCGQSVLDTLPTSLRPLARRMLRGSIIDAVPLIIERIFFGNRTTRADRARIRKGLCRESSALITEVTSDWPAPGTPIGWILPLYDRALPPRVQLKFIAHLGGVVDFATIDAGHELLFTHADELAQHISAMVGHCP